MGDGTVMYESNVTPRAHRAKWLGESQKKPTSTTHPSTIESIINPPKLPHRLLHHLIHLGLLGHIDLHDQNPVLRVCRQGAALERSGFGGGLVHVGECDTGGTFGGIGEGTAFADAGACQEGGT